MTDEINQGREVGKSIVDNWPLLAIIFAPIAELGRRVFKSATHADLTAAQTNLYAAIEKTRRESDRKIELCHKELREDIQMVGHAVDDLKNHLLRRREDKG